MSILFASLILLIEEVQDVSRFYKDSKTIQSLRIKHDRYNDLSLDGKKKVRVFYDVKIKSLDKAQKLISRESSIQVALQLTLISYQENFQVTEKDWNLYSRILSVGRTPSKIPGSQCPEKFFVPGQSLGFLKFLG